MVNTLEPFQINIVIAVFSYLFLYHPLWQSRQLMGKQKETTPISVGNSLLHLIYFNGEGNYPIQKVRVTATNSFFHKYIFEISIIMLRRHIKGLRMLERFAIQKKILFCHQKLGIIFSHCPHFQLKLQDYKIHNFDILKQYSDYIYKVITFANSSNPGKLLLFLICLENTQNGR